MKIRIKLKHLKHDIKKYAEKEFENDGNKKVLINSYVEVMYSWHKEQIKKWYE